MTNTYRIVSVGDMYQATKADGTLLDKRNIVLQELGGMHANKYVGTALGFEAHKAFSTGDLVHAVLRFATHDYQERTFQDVTISEIVKA